MILNNKYLVYFLLIFVALFTIFIAYKVIYKEAFNDGVMYERTKQEKALNEKMKAQEKALNEYYIKEIEKEKQSKIVEIIYVDSKKKIEDMKKEDKNVGLTKEQASELTEIFKGLK